MVASVLGSPKRGVAGLAAIALVVGVAALAGVAPAQAAPATNIVQVTQIADHESDATYTEWHEGYTKTSRDPDAFQLRWDGLHFGINSMKSQILKGLEPTVVTGSELSDLITGASVDVLSGEAFLQVPLYFGEPDQVPRGFTTLRPANGATGPDTGYDASANWMSSRDIPNGSSSPAVSANTAEPLNDIITALEAQGGSIQLLGFGVLARPTSPTTVAGLTWDGTYYQFVDKAWIPLASGQQVTESDIRPDETTYAGWHEGYDGNTTQAYSVQADGLHLATATEPSQIINGLATPNDVDASELANLITSSRIDVSSGTAYFQVPIFYGSGDSFTTLRPASGATDSAGFGLDDDWMTSNPIPDAGTVLVPADTPAPLRAIIAALEDQGSIRVLGFGVLANAGAPAVVSSLDWNGVRYTFRPASAGGGTEPTPTPPAAPQGATDADSATSTDPDGTATAISGETTVTAQGEGAFTVAQYSSNPAEPAPVEGDREFFDVLLAEGSDFDSLTVTQCGLPADAHSIVWFTGSSWVKASDVTYDDGCATVTITDATSPSLSDLTGTVFAAGELPVNRLAGEDRIGTAVAASQHRYPAADSADAVVLARSDAYPDALAGAPLADAHDAPILLTRPGELAEETLAEMRRVLPGGGTVYLLGGPKAVSATVAGAVTDAGFVVERIAGDDRYQTAVAIADALGNPGTVFEVPGTNFPDAIAAGPAAATLDGAILLTRGDEQAAATARYLAAHPGVTRYAVGGISAQADPKATGVSGDDRYDTAAAVTRRFFSGPTRISLATGLRFPDALTAGPAAGVPVLLVRGTGTELPDSTTTYLQRASASTTTLNVYGGTGAVRPGLAEAAELLLQ